MESYTRPVNLLDNDIFVEIEGVRVGEVNIPSGYVSYSFTPLVEEHLIIGGDKLHDGMVVLMADRLGREDPQRIAAGANPSVHDRARVQETSRWALVTNFESYEVRGNRLIKFDAVYADGTMIPRSYSVKWKWAVMKDVVMRPVCPEHGVIHDHNDFLKAMSDIVNNFLDSLVEEYRTPSTGIVSDEDQDDFVKYAEADIDMTQKLGEKFAEINAEQGVVEIQENVAILEEASRRIQDGDSMEEIVRELGRKPGKWVWLEDISIQLVEEGDLIPFAGTMYRVIGIRHGFSGISLFTKSIRDTELDESPITEFVVANNVTMKLKRRVQR